VDPETGSLPKDSPRQTARVSLSSNPAAAGGAPAPATAGGGGGGGAEPYVKVTSTVTTATTTTSNFIIRTSALDFKVCSARPRHFADVFPSPHVAWPCFVSCVHVHVGAGDSHSAARTGRRRRGRRQWRRYG